MEINYNVLPTFAKVHQCQEQNIFVMGPVGCLSHDTEVMTRSGWVKISEYEDQEILNWNIIDGTSNFERPEKYIVEECEELIKFNNKHSLSMVLSKEHVVPCYNYNNELVLTTAEALAKKPSRSKIITNFTLKEDSLGMSEEEIRLWVAISADGHFPSRGKQCVFSLRKERKKERLEKLLTSLNISFSKRVHSSRPTEVVYTFDRGVFTKHFDERLYTASSRELSIIVDEVKFWDGLNTEETRFYTSRLEQAEFIQFAAHATGHRATISTQTYDNSWQNTYVVFIASGIKSKVVIRKDTCNIKTVKSEDGKKYCFTTTTGFFVARHNGCIFVTGNSGKTTGCIWHIIMNAMKQKPDSQGVRRSRYMIVRDTYPALKTTTLKSWINWFKDRIRIVHDIPIRGYVDYQLDDGTRMEMELIFLAVGSAQDVEKLRSFEVTGAHINEAAKIDREVLDMVKSRIKRYPIDSDGSPMTVDPFILCDYNAVSTDHWLYKLAEEERPENHAFFRQPPAVLYINNKYYVNPEAENVAKYDTEGNRISPGVEPDYYINMCYGSDPDFVYVNVMNNYGEVRSGRPVYKDYDDVFHVAERGLKPMAGVPIVIGMDQGLTPACVFTQQGPDGTVYVLDEIVTEDCSLQEFCNDLLWPKIRNEYKAWEKNFYIVCDPATANRSMNDSKAGTEIIKEAGLSYKTAKTNAFMARKEAVVHFLRLNKKFCLDPKCTTLRKGFIVGYKYAEVNTAQGAIFKDMPSKNEFSHVHDALQYAMLEYHYKTKKRPTVNRKKYSVGSTIGGY